MGGRRVGSVGFALLVVLVSLAHADSRIIDSPAAQILGHGQLRVEIGAGPEGSVTTRALVGTFDRVAFGFSYGMQKVLGRGSVEAYPHPGLQVQVLVVDNPDLPAIAVGFDSQGSGRWLEDLDRYERKSTGFYAVMTQHLIATSYDIFFSVTGGVGYSLEPNRQSMDLFVGASQEIGGGLALLVDYDFALDDQASVDTDRGYLDLGFQWQFGGGNHLRFLLRDLLGNYKGSGEVARELNFFYLLRL